MTNSNFIIQRLFARREPYTAILNLSTKQLYDEVLGQELIHLGSSALVAYRYVAARMCMGCLQFDHTEANCCYNVTWCARCGSSEHAISDCNNNSRPRWRNCTLRGEKWTTHMATAPNCPYRLDVLDALAEKIIG